MADIDQKRLSYFPETVIGKHGLPEKFTFPFYYEPHPLARLAAAELQAWLESRVELDHNFGLTPESLAGAIGKMFGVLIVQDSAGRAGYLWGFSGKLANSNDHPEFVPPVFDMLVEDSFFLKGIETIDALNAELEALETDESHIARKAELERLSNQSAKEISDCKQQLKTNREARKIIREQQREALNETDFTALDAGLINQSLYDKRQLKNLTDRWSQALSPMRAELAIAESRIEALKVGRKERSAALQQRLFEQYTFLNIAGKSRSLQDIFSETAFGRPPSAAGECATPKLLQHAFLNRLKPLAMAEFWWGASPKSEIRKHRQFYPACTGKCKPILAHMLDGMELDDNPFLQIPVDGPQLEVVYEDEHLIVVNKPSGLRSVPGVDIFDSVYSRLKVHLADVEPLTVHRLDMDTSGLMVVAKTPDVHRHIQKQFLRRTVKKRYTALLSGTVDGDEGEIDLPLRADLFNRPRQLVCFESGKRSITKWKVVDRVGRFTKVHFWPLTGRTHQLRMHAAHGEGLNAPIVGDDLYGTASTRLHLHAEELRFVHPVTKVELRFEVGEVF